MALSDESSQESPGFPKPPVAEPAVHESGVEDEQLAEGTLGFRANRSQASAKLSTRRRLHDSDNPTESWAVHSIRIDSAATPAATGLTVSLSE